MSFSPVCTHPNSAMPFTREFNKDLASRFSRWLRVATDCRKDGRSREAKRERKPKIFSIECRELASGRNLVGAGCGYTLDVLAFLFLLKKGRNAINDLIQGGLGTEAGEGMQLFDEGHTAHHVLEAGFVGLVVRHVLNGRGTAGTLLHSLCQCLDGDFLGVADVDDFADGALRVHEADESFDSVADIAEAPRLLSGAVDADGGVVQGGLDEIGEDHSVASRLPGTNGIEQANHDDGQLLFLPVGDSKKLIERFGSRVTPAALCGGAKDKVRIFVERK